MEYLLGLKGLNIGIEGFDILDQRVHGDIFLDRDIVCSSGDPSIKLPDLGNVKEFPVGISIVRNEVVAPFDDQNAIQEIFLPKMSI